MPRDPRGQATVELVALLPVLAVLALGLWQVATAGHAMWSAGAAARAASRAAAVGGDAERTARRILPDRLAAAAKIRTGDDGAVTVTVPVRAVAGGPRLATFSTTAHFEPQQ